MTHTKEPWRIVNCDAVPSTNDDGLRLLEIRAGKTCKVASKGNVAGYIDCGGKFVASCNTRADPEAEANARRIVSCVNALAGMNPDALAGLIEAAEGMYRVQTNSEAHTIAELMEATEELGTALARLRGEA